MPLIIFLFNNNNSKSDFMKLGMNDKRATKIQSWLWMFAQAMLIRWKDRPQNRVDTVVLADARLVVFDCHRWLDCKHSLTTPLSSWKPLTADLISSTSQSTLVFFSPFFLSCKILCYLSFFCCIFILWSISSQKFLFVVTFWGPHLA